MDSNYEFLEGLKKDIEALNKEQQLHILKLLDCNSDVTLNENKSGVFINLTHVSSRTLSMIEEYLKYLRDQENTIMELEQKKIKYKNTYFDQSTDQSSDSVLLS